jgi:hypothetical protein
LSFYVNFLNRKKFTSLLNVYDFIHDDIRITTTVCKLEDNFIVKKGSDPSVNVLQKICSYEKSFYSVLLTPLIQNSPNLYLNEESQQVVLNTMAEEVKPVERKDSFSLESINKDLKAYQTNDIAVQRRGKF